MFTRGPIMVIFKIIGPCFIGNSLPNVTGKIIDGLWLSFNSYYCTTLLRYVTVLDTSGRVVGNLSIAGSARRSPLACCIKIVSSPVLSTRGGSF